MSNRPPWNPDNGVIHVRRIGLFSKDFFLSPQKMLCKWMTKAHYYSVYGGKRWHVNGVFFLSFFFYEDTGFLKLKTLYCLITYEAPRCERDVGSGVLKLVVCPSLWLFKALLLWYNEGFLFTSCCLFNAIVFF